MRKVFFRWTSAECGRDTRVVKRPLSSLFPSSLARPVLCHGAVEIQEIIRRNYISPNLTLFALKKVTKKPPQKAETNDEDVDVCVFSDLCSRLCFQVIIIIIFIIF